MSTSLEENLALFRNIEETAQDKEEIMSTLMVMLRFLVAVII